ncbi:MAG: LuxR C-terminal-related transcriptional regulator [Prevotella sp.]|jgi:DNA-binding CsgD family transcriptional regulator|nr:LuxR C-terminal-related transcriptional regulator [Prevotella sp.]
MGSIEFRNDQRGNVFYQEEHQPEKHFTKFNKEIIDFILERINQRFPSCYARLISLYRNTPPTERKFFMAIRFIKCNLGSEDFLSFDIEDQEFNFEEVKCPLRGLCRDEGIICKPRGLVSLPPEEKKTAKLYLKGYTFREIAQRLNKSPATVKVQLCRIKDKLGVKNCREIIKYLRLTNF